MLVVVWKRVYIVYERESRGTSFLNWKARKGHRFLRIHLKPYISWFTGGQFDRWRNSEYPEKTTDLPQVTDKQWYRKLVPLLSGSLLKLVHLSVHFKSLPPPLSDPLENLHPTLRSIPTPLYKVWNRQNIIFDEPPAFYIPIILKIAYVYIFLPLNVVRK
jgi:hypothetical protein